jgi:RNA polymerase sigma-70 factor (ECF subfamily)
MPTYLRPRLVAGQRLAQIHRQHLGAAPRGAGRAVSPSRGALPQVSSAKLAARLLGRLTTASQAAIRAERQLRLQEVLNGLDAIDREVLALRHFEGHSNGEAAQVLGLSKSAASNRYIRALGRLRDLLGRVPGVFDQG